MIYKTFQLGANLEAKAATTMAMREEGGKGATKQELGVTSGL